jgi:hypothetical protein
MGGMWKMYHVTGYTYTICYDILPYNDPSGYYQEINHRATHSHEHSAQPFRYPRRLAQPQTR